MSQFSHQRYLATELTTFYLENKTRALVGYRKCVERKNKNKTLRPRIQSYHESHRCTEKQRVRSKHFRQLCVMYTRIQRNALLRRTRNRHCDEKLSYRWQKWQTAQRICGKCTVLSSTSMQSKHGLLRPTRGLQKWQESIGYPWLPIGLSLKISLCLVSFPRYYHLFMHYENTWPQNNLE